MRRWHQQHKQSAAGVQALAGPKHHSQTKQLQHPCLALSVGITYAADIADVNPASIMQTIHGSDRTTTTCHDNLKL
jgi:hypothetical protein